MQRNTQKHKKAFTSPRFTNQSIRTQVGHSIGLMTGGVQGLALSREKLRPLYTVLEAERMTAKLFRQILMFLESESTFPTKVNNINCKFEAHRTKQKAHYKRIIYALKTEGSAHAETQIRTLGFVV